VKVFLLHPDRDFSPKPELRDQMFEAMLSANLHAIDYVSRELERQNQPAAPPGAVVDEALTQDLELNTLWNWMARGNRFLFEMSKRVVLTALRDPDEIRYRQQVLADCLEHPETVEEIYRLALKALASERDVGSLWSGASPGYILHRAVRVLQLHTEALQRLRHIAETQAQEFRSEGFGRFFAMLREELADDYLQSVERHLQELELKGGVLESAELGKGDKGRRYVFHRPPERRRSWLDRLPFAGRTPGYSFELAPRDERGARALEEIKTRAINHAADAVGRSADHVESFFVMLRLELAFYLACLNLHRRLAEKGEPVCFPEPTRGERPVLTAQGIYDVGLTLHLHDPVVRNDLRADGKALLVITGANQGGKSTLLRALGLAQLMMQSGMFAAAESLRLSVCDGLFTHYKREEDETMESGKLDEELRRMSEIAERITPGSLLLCNESFASTNEREGSEIARQVIRAMLEKRIRVLFVTHMYDLAHSLHSQRLEPALFLRAERAPDGARTFKLLEGEPLPTSHGEDSYRRVFGNDSSGSAAMARDDAAS